MTERLKEFLQQKRWLQLKKTDWIAVALVGVLLLVVAMPSGGTGIHLAENKKEDTAQEKTEQKYEKEDYAEYLEHKLEQVLGQMEGVGKVSVMVTVADQGEDLCDTTNREQAQRQDTPFFHAEIAKKIKGWIDADGYIRPGLTIKELSDVLHTNRTYLSGYIKTTYDMSFRDWITGLRIEYAKRLLARYPRLTIADISEKSGFLSPSHFIRLFKENAGCTPVKWRKTEAE